MSLLLSRCRDSSVGIVTKLRAGLSRIRSIPGGGSRSKTAVNIFRISPERFKLPERTALCRFSAVACLLVALTGRAAQPYPVRCEGPSLVSVLQACRSSSRSRHIRKVMWQVTSARRNDHHVGHTWQWNSE
jgi:hypothetical protein